MKVAILAGGLGTRLAEETKTKPKALVEIGGYPILWHIMMYYHHFGFNEFVIALGYKGDHIKHWMTEYRTLNGNLTVKIQSGEVIRQETTQDIKDWTVHLVDTGQNTNNGGRIKRLAPWLDNETFMLTWCDGLADVDLNTLIEFHRSHNRLATLTAVHPPPRFGHLVLHGDRVINFKEKILEGESWVNGAFFVLEPGIFDYIKGDETQWEKEPLEKLVADGQLMAYKHSGFWQCMDTLREKELLEELWETGKAPWKKWKG